MRISKDLTYDSQHYQTGLGPGPHQLKLIGGDNGPYLDLDSINIYSTTGGTQGGSTNGTSPRYAQVPTMQQDLCAKLQSSASSNSSTLSTGIIAAIAGGAVAFMLFILAFVIFFVRRRRGQRSGSSTGGEKSLNLNLETGPGRAASFEKPQYGGAPPLSTTSSFFALERSSRFPPSKLATYPESTDSGSTMPSMPTMPPGVGQYPRQSAGSFGPTDWTVETPSTGGDPYFNSVGPTDLDAVRATDKSTHRIGPLGIMTSKA